MVFGVISVQNKRIHKIGIEYNEKKVNIMR